MERLWTVWGVDANGEVVRYEVVDSGVGIGLLRPWPLPQRVARRIAEIDALADGTVAA